jgi:hypothetical protein
MSSLTDLVSEISGFVNKAMGKPSESESDYWRERVYAALFSASFEPFLILAHAETHSEDDFNNLLDLFTKDLSEKASSWMEEAFAQSIPSKYHDKIKFANGVFAPMGRARLNSYFHMALTAMVDRNYDIEFARSHSCFSGLSHLWDTGPFIPDKVDFRKDLEAYFEYTIKFCEGLSRTMHNKLWENKSS